jgi:serine/threonine protein kinase
MMGRYQVLRPLAKGGMAEVLLARSIGIKGFERFVVLKRILLQHENEHSVEMFLDEARLVAGLHHRNIVQVHDIGEEEGKYFFAMEYVHGEDVRALLRAA